MIGVYTLVKFYVIDLSEVANKPIYVNITSYRLILAVNLKPLLALKYK